MEQVPGDIAVLILRKLGAHDSVSLLTATCALALFHRAVKQNPDIRLEGDFFGKDLEDIKN